MVELEISQGEMSITFTAIAPMPIMEAEEYVRLMLPLIDEANKANQMWAKNAKPRKSYPVRFRSLPPCLRSLYVAMGRKPDGSQRNA